MAVMGSTITEFIFFPDAPPSIVGELVTGKTVTIELWQDGVAVSLGDNSCTEIDNTGQYTWSLGNIATLSASRVQYHWRMLDTEGNSDQGDIVLISQENRDGMMPSIASPTTYLV